MSQNEGNSNKSLTFICMINFNFELGKQLIVIGSTTTTRKVQPY